MSRLLVRKASRCSSSGVGRRSTSGGGAPSCGCCVAARSMWCTPTSSDRTCGRRCSSLRAGLPVLIAHEHSWSYEGSLRRIVDRELIARRADAIVAVSPTDRHADDRARAHSAEEGRLHPEWDPRSPAGGRPTASGVSSASTSSDLGRRDGVRPAAGERARDGDSGPWAAGSAPPPACASSWWVTARNGDGSSDSQTSSACRPSSSDIARTTRYRISWRRWTSLVLSSRFEGMPLAVLEWMAAGKAIVASRVGRHPRDHRARPRSACLFRRATTSHSRMRLRACWTILLERRRLGEAAQRRQREEFRFDRRSPC